MANTYFQFKQFTVHQDKCAMKVCTDSCIFGALLPLCNIQNKKIENALDIGTGTGLLSLMYAQRNTTAQIEAIEIEANAFLQAKENCLNSKFSSQISIEKGDFFEKILNNKYDLIFSNPPFYNNDLPSNKLAKNLAHHSAAFDFNHFLAHTKTKLNTNGILALLLPSEKQKQITNNIALNKWHIIKLVDIYNNEKKKPFRQIYFLSKEETTIQMETLIIKEKENYSNNFITLLKPFYLNL